jgi:hypothetical protein
MNSVNSTAETSAKNEVKRRSGAPRIELVPRRVQDFLIRLTPTRAFTLFSIALLAGVGLILSNITPLWGPLVPVLFYGLALAYAQKRFFVQLDGTLKDSPYFLGFILTLFALYDIFLQISAAGDGGFAIPVIVGKAGGAILPTVVGLFMRQVLLSLDPSEEARDALFQSLAKEIREQTVEFHQTQARFVKLVTEFTSAREKMFSREEKVFTRYVERLDAGASVLGRLQEQYPARIDELLAKAELARDRFAALNQQMEEQIGKWREAMDTRIEAAGSQHEAAIRASESAVTKAGEGLEAQTRALLEVVEKASPDLSDRVREIEGALAKYASSATSVSEGLRGVADQASTTREDLRALGASARSSGVELVQATTDTGEQLRKLLQERLQATHDDLKAIDAIIDELARVLRERLTPVSAQS